MKWLCAIILLVGVNTTASADLSLFVGSDNTHGMNTPSQKKALDLRYFGKQWPHWAASVTTFGTSGGQTVLVCSELYQSWKRLYIGWGPCLKNNSHDDVVNGKFAYQIRIGWNFYEHEYRRVKSVGLELLHISNCSSAFKSINRKDCLIPGLPRGEKPNETYNFLGVRIKW